MTTFLCIADIHEDEKKLEQLVEFSKGCDAILDCGDDLDRFVNSGDESASIIRDIHREYSDIVSRERRVRSMKDEFRKVYGQKAERINEHYRRIGIPVFAVLGNHDPSFAAGRMGALNYIQGKCTDFMGLTIAGLPATGEFVRMVADFCPEYFQHIGWYDESRVSEAAKNILESNNVDIFITHKTFRPEFHSWSSRPGLWNCDYAYPGGVDAGAVAVYRKFRPRFCVFGHYHMKEPWQESVNGRLFLCPGVNYAVRVSVDNGIPAVSGALKFT